MAQEIVKVKLPLDERRALRTGKMYADKSDRKIMIYDRRRRHAWVGVDKSVREFLLAAENGQGYLKAYLWAEWDAEKGAWRVDLTKGFAPLEKW